MDESELDTTECLSQDALRRVVAFTERRPVLAVLEGALAGRRFRLNAIETLIGRAETADIVLTDRGVSRFHAKLIRSPDGTVTLTDLGSTNGTFVGGERIDFRILKEGDKIGIGAATALQFMASEVVEENVEPAEPLLTERQALKRLNQEVSAARRHQTTLIVATAEVDQLDELRVQGDAAVQAVLCSVARLLQTNLREEDLVGRLPGDRFLILMRQTKVVGGQRTAERMRRSVAQGRFRVPVGDAYEGARVTVSIGLAQSRREVETEELLGESLQALARAREAGGNAVSERPSWTSSPRLFSFRVFSDTTGRALSLSAIPKPLLRRHRLNCTRPPAKSVRLRLRHGHAEGDHRGPPLLRMTGYCIPAFSISLSTILRAPTPSAINFPLPS